MTNQIEDKYTLSTVSKEVNGKKVYRIVSLINIPRFDVKVGTIGGFVETMENLSNYHDCWIADDAIVMEEARVTMDAYISGEAIISGISVIKEDARVEDTAKVDGSSVVSKRAVISGKAQVTSSRVSTTAKVTGNAVLIDSVIGGNSFVYESAHIQSSNVIGDIEVSSTAYVSKCKVRGKRIELLGNVRLENVKIGTSKCRYIDIRENAQIKDSEISGEGIFISGYAVLKSGVVIEGETTHIDEYAEVSGNILIGKNVYIGEFAKLLNTDKKTWKFAQARFVGDFEMVEYNT